jgi:PAS domain S-box-containing protein
LYINESIFQNLVEASPYPVYLISGDELIIAAANKATLEAWGKDSSVIGMRFREAIPELKDQPFEQLLKDVIASGKPYYAINDRADLMIDGKLETFYFNFTFQPMFNDKGETIAVMCYATDVSAIEKARLSEQQLRSNIEVGQLQLKLAIEGANLGTWYLDPITKKINYGGLLAEIFGYTGREPMSYDAIFAQISPEFQRKVRQTIIDTINMKGAYDITYSQFKFNNRELIWVRSLGRAIADEQGNTMLSGVIMDVTDQIMQTEEIKKLNEITSKTNTDLVSINEELAASNEELTASNEELAEVNEELAISHEELKLSEKRFRSLIMQAPFAICIIRAEDLMIDEVNNRYLELVGKRRQELEGRTIWEAVPETAKVYAPVMQEVINSGIPFVASEHEVMLVRNNIGEIVFIDFVYEPVKNLEGKVTSVMVVGIDVTEKVKARKSIEEVEEQIRLAVEAADMGTYGFFYTTGEVVASDRFNEIFEIKSGASREEMLKAFHPEDANISDEAHEIAKHTGKLFYEARLLNKDNSLRWIRVQGNVYFDENGNRIRTLGTVLDITDYKKLQQQKDDFISIASHELKTPITSLKASLQLLARMKENPNGAMFPRLIDQASRSMDKISELVEDLLNVSKMNEGQIMLKKQWFTVADMINKCCNHVREGGKFELITLGDKNLQIFADEHRIDQVIVNFVNNVVKYAPNSTTIYLIIEKIGDLAKISVKDKGPGIPPDQIPHLFDRYFRADPSGIQVSGLGLGLYICADIVKRHGGEIGVDSELGKGSTFWITLPIDGVN